VLYGTNDLFHPRKRVEFHAEWLRDEPFDATTTGQLLGTGVNSLLETGNMRFGWCHSFPLSLWSTILCIPLQAIESKRREQDPLAFGVE